MRGLPRWSMLHLAQAIMIACEASLWHGPSGGGALPLYPSRRGGERRAQPW
jgi:hypothetical protein